MVVRGSEWLAASCVAQRHAGVEGGGDEGVPEGVWTDALGDGGSAGDASHDPPGCVTVEASTVGLGEDGTVESLSDGQIDSAGDAWCERHRRGLAALADHGEGAMAALQAEGVDVGADRFGDS